VLPTLVQGQPQHLKYQNRIKKVILTTVEWKEGLSDGSCVHTDSMCFIADPCKMFLHNYFSTASRLAGDMMFSTGLFVHLSLRYQSCEHDISQTDY